MATAEVGDDGSGEDPTVRRLEERVADMLGMPAAVFVPSGTMANQVALRTLAENASRVCAGARQHVVGFEDGAAGVNGYWQLHTVSDLDGVPDFESVRYVLSAAAHHQVATSVLCLENTHMAAGGRAWAPETASPLVELARGFGCRVHLDGARLFNAAVALGRPVADWARLFDSVTVCLSKGLSAPVGSVVAGNDEFVTEARRNRKRLGGAMRQAGVVAAAGLWALDHMVDRLVDDHERASELAALVAQRWPGAIDPAATDPAATDPAATMTNIVVFSHPHPEQLHAHMRSRGILGGTIADGVVRWVTHRHISAADIDTVAWASTDAPD